MPTTRSTTRAMSSAVTASTARDQLVERRDLAQRQLAAAEAVHAARSSSRARARASPEVSLGRVELARRRRRRRRRGGRARRRPRRAARRGAPAPCRPSTASAPVSSNAARYEYTEYARPRFSRTSWNRRDDMPPPSAWFSTDERVAVGIVASAATACRARRAPARWAASSTADGRGAGAPGYAIARSDAPRSVRASPRSTSPTTSSWSRLPAAATTTLLGW